MRSSARAGVAAGPEGGGPPALGRVVVVRHGETEWSRSGQHTSRTDLPLLPEGRERAAALGAELTGWTFAAVLVSPLLRARETAALAGLGGRAVLDDDLREWEYGEYEGLTTPQIRETDPEWSLWRDGAPGGESPADVGARADRVLARASRTVETGGDVALVAHGHVLRVITARWLGLPPAAGALFALSAGALGTLGHERRQPVLSRWNA